MMNARNSSLALQPLLLALLLVASVTGPVAAAPDEAVDENQANTNVQTTNQHIYESQLGQQDNDSSNPTFDGPQPAVERNNSATIPIFFDGAEQAELLIEGDDGNYSVRGTISDIDGDGTGIVTLDTANATVANGYGLSSPCGDTFSLDQDAQNDDSTAPLPTGTYDLTLYRDGIATNLATITVTEGDGSPSSASSSVACDGATSDNGPVKPPFGTAPLTWVPQGNVAAFPITTGESETVKVSVLPPWSNTVNEISGNVTDVDGDGEVTLLLDASASKTENGSRLSAIGGDQFVVQKASDHPFERGLYRVFVWSTSTRISSSGSLVTNAPIPSSTSSVSLVVTNSNCQATADLPEGKAVDVSGDNPAFTSNQFDGAKWGHVVPISVDMNGHSSVDLTVGSKSINYLVHGTVTDDGDGTVTVLVNLADPRAANQYGISTVGADEFTVDERADNEGSGRALDPGNYNLELGTDDQSTLVVPEFDAGNFCPASASSEVTYKSTETETETTVQRETTTDGEDASNSGVPGFGFGAALLALASLAVHRR